MPNFDGTFNRYGPGQQDDTASASLPPGAPNPPADVTTATPAAGLNYWGSFGMATTHLSDHVTWQTTLGTTGYLGGLSGSAFLPGYGQNFNFKVSTPNTYNVVSAIGDATSTYDWQRAYEGGGAPSVNGQAATVSGLQLGIFQIQNANPAAVARTGLAYYMHQSGNPANGPFGDWFNTTVMNAVAYQIGLQAAGITFLGGNMIGFDLEVGSWTPTAYAGHTQAQIVQQAELWGYTIGTQIYTANPAINIWIYSLEIEGGFHALINSNNGTQLTVDTRGNLACGMMRAHKDMNATGNISWADHQFYRASTSGTSLGTTQTACKYNTQGTLASLSRYLDPTVWTHIAPYWQVTPYSWAGADGTPSYDNSQENEPVWTQAQEIYRQYGMGGYRFTYSLSDSNGQVPGTSTSALSTSKWFGGSNYGLGNTGPGDSRHINMLAATDQTSSGRSAAYSTTAPTLTAAASGSGATRTLSGTAAHDFGIRYVEAYIYPSGAKVRAQMTFNWGGGTPTQANVATSHQDWTLNLTGVTAGTFAIVTAWSTLGQQHSTVVAL